MDMVRQEKFRRIAVLQGCLPRSHTKLPVRLFLSICGSEELLIPRTTLRARYNKRVYMKAYHLEAHIIEGERRGGNKPEAFNRGLRSLLTDPAGGLPQTHGVNKVSEPAVEAFC